MALMKDVTLQGGYIANDVYFMLGSTTVHFGGRLIDVCMVAFKDQATAQAFQLNRKDYREAMSAYEIAKAVQLELDENPTDSDEYNAVVSSKEVAKANILRLREELPDVHPLDMNVNIHIPPSKVDDVLDINGEISRPALYAYIKMLPEWSTAADT
jgi:hypothetical protein